MPNNYGWKSRQAEKAVTFALRDAAARGEVSYSTAATVADRFATAWQELREDGMRWLEDVTREAVIEYGRDLAERVEAGEMTPSYAQNLISAVNTAMTIASRGRWESVSPTRDCGIAQRSAIREDVPGALDREAYGRALDAVRDQLGDRAAAVVELCRELGLRSKEASLIDARSALQEAISNGFLHVTEGTKGGRERVIPVSERQIEALGRAAAAQGSDRSMIPAALSWKEWREGTLRDAREIVQQYTGGGLHDMRAAYACERYQTLTGSPAPVAGGQVVDRDLDRAARERIAQELGHGRIDVVAEYVGGR